jgi:sugar lactone lactonase YvrE
VANGCGAVTDVFSPSLMRLGEGPLWDARTQTLHWVDIIDGVVLSQALDAALPRRVDVGTQIGCLGLTADPNVLVAGMRTGWHLLNLQTGERRFLADAERDRESCRFNDGAVDAAGRFWTGSLEDGESRPCGRLYVLRGDCSYSIADEGFYCSNGIDWSPDGRWLYFVDSRRNMIYRYAFDVERGAAFDRQVFVNTTALDGIPDGLRVDSVGDIWCAFWDGAHVTRISSDGVVLEQIPVPVLRPTSVSFGGPDLRTMFITSASFGLTGPQLRRWPLSGAVLQQRVGTPGSAAHHFVTTEEGAMHEVHQ